MTTVLHRRIYSLICTCELEPTQRLEDLSRLNNPFMTISELGNIFALLGTISLALGLLKTNKQIDLESGTYYNRNRFLAGTMRRDRIFATIGLILIFLGFVVAILPSDIRGQFFDPLSGWFNKLIDVLVVLFGVYAAFALHSLSEKSAEREGVFQILSALQHEISRNEQHLKTMQSPPNQEIQDNVQVYRDLLSLEVEKFYLNSPNTYKYGGVISELWSYMDDIRYVKHKPDDKGRINAALEKTTKLIHEIENLRERLSKKT